MAKKGFVPWNKGLTKENDERLVLLGRKVSQSIWEELLNVSNIQK